MKEVGRGTTIDEKIFITDTSFIGFRYLGNHDSFRKFHSLFRKFLRQAKAERVCEYMGKDYPRKYGKTFLFKKNTLRSKGGRK